MRLIASVCIRISWSGGDNWGKSLHWNCIYALWSVISYDISTNCQTEPLPWIRTQIMARTDIKNNTCFVYCICFDVSMMFWCATKNRISLDCSNFLLLPDSGVQQFLGETKRDNYFLGWLIGHWCSCCCVPVPSPSTHRAMSVSELDIKAECETAFKHPEACFPDQHSQLAPSPWRMLFPVTSCWGWWKHCRQFLVRVRELFQNGWKQPGLWITRRSQSTWK